MNIIKEFALVIEETPSQGQSSHDAQSKEEPVELFVFAVASQPFQPPQRIIAARTEPIIISALIVRGPFRLSAFFLGPSILLSTIFRASTNASVGVEHGFVAASLKPSSSYTVTMKPAWRVRSSR
jgi:hypothetical protein